MTDASIFEIKQVSGEAGKIPQLDIRVPVSRFAEGNNFADLLGTTGAPLIQAACEARGLNVNLTDLSLEQARELAASVEAEPIKVQVKNQELSIALNVQ